MSLSIRDDICDPPDLNALIGSRICHDLISPLGAIGNGVELLTLSGFDKSPEIALIAQSVESANARIRYFRVAFGAAGPEQALGAAEIVTILDAISQTGRHRIAWTFDGPVSRPIAKLGFLVILCLESAMPRGGRITVTRTGDRWQVAGEAERLKIEDDHWECLVNPDAIPRVTSSSVEFPLAALATRSLGRRIETDLAETRAVVTF